MRSASPPATALASARTARPLRRDRAVRAAVKPGTALLTEGTTEDNATVLSDGTQRMVQVSRASAESA